MQSPDDAYSQMMRKMLAAMPPESVAPWAMRRVLTARRLQLLALGSLPATRGDAEPLELRTFRERTSKLSYRSQELVIYACVLSLLAHEQVQAGSGRPPNEASVHTEQAAIFARAAIEAAGVAAGIEPSEIAEVEAALDVFAGCTSDHAASSADIGAEYSTAGEVGQDAAHQWYEKVNIVPPEGLAWSSGFWDGEADVVCWDLGIARAVPETLFESLSAVEEQARLAGAEPPIKVVYAPKLPPEEAGRLLAAGVSWLDSPLEAGVSLRHDIAALLAGETMDHPGAGRGTDEAAATGSAATWSPEQEVAEGEKFYADLVQRSQPFEVRLEREQGWPSQA